MSALTTISEIYELLKTIVLSSELTENDSFLHLILEVLDEAQQREYPEFSLTLLPAQVCAVVGGSANDTIPVAAAWRALHLAAKLFDDVEDGDDVIVASKVLSPGIAVNLATGFMAISNIILVEHEFLLPDAEVARRSLVQEFNRTVLQMCVGQHRDLEDDQFLDIDEYRKIMAAKSGSFFQLAAWSGARCGTNDEDILSLMESFGYNLGMMLQLNDDLQDFRKEGPGGDLAAGKPTFPVYYALSVASPPEQKRLLSLLNEAPTNVHAEMEARSLIRALGGEVYMMAEIMRYRRRAMAALDEMNLPKELRSKLDAWLARLSLNPATIKAS